MKKGWAVVFTGVAGSLAFGFLSPTYAWSQSPAATTRKFDVVLIKPVDPHHVIHNEQDSPFMPGGEFSMQNTTVRWLLLQAYAVPMNRSDLRALPDWAKTTHFSIDAKPAEGFPNLPPAQNIQEIRLMLRAMLADRFQVTVHHETRETQAYEMTWPNNALKNVLPGDASQPPDGDFNAGNDFVSLVGKNVPMSVFGDWIGALLGRPVIDKTGLGGVYNFDVRRRADPGAGATQPADGGCDVGCRSLIAGALSDQLGLKLHATTASVDFLVLDHIEKPAAN